MKNTSCLPAYRETEVFLHTVSFSLLAEFCRLSLRISLGKLCIPVLIYELMRDQTVEESDSWGIRQLGNRTIGILDSWGIRQLGSGKQRVGESDTCHSFLLFFFFFSFMDS